MNLTRSLQVVALEALHAKKVIHRDIKPGNILFQADGHIVLADFGNATQFKDSDSKESVIPTEPSWVSFEVQEDAESGFFLKEQQPYETREVRGTPYYMCPEQHYAEPYSYDADYWSLGVVLFRMITGRVRISSFLSVVRYSDIPGRPDALRHRWQR